MHTITQPTVAFLGLGSMGTRIASRLLDASYDLRVFNRNRERSTPFSERGAYVADSPRDAAQGADIVLSMVTDDEASRAIWLHPIEGALFGMNPKTHAIELSTLTPTWIRTLAAEAHTRSIHFIESPVVGTLPQAESGTLIGLLAGPEDVCTSLRPILETFCTSTHHTGPLSTASTAKLLVNSIFATHTAVLGQSIALGRSLGLPEETLLTLLHDLPITSPSMRVIGGLIAKRMYSPLFPIDLVAKDLRYTVQSAQEVHAHTPAFEATLATYQEAQRHGLGNQNITAIASLFLDEVHEDLQPKPTS